MNRYTFEYLGFEAGDLFFITPDVCNVVMWFNYEIQELDQDEMFQVKCTLNVKKTGVTYDFDFYEEGYVDHDQVKQEIYTFFDDGALAVVHDTINDIAFLSNPADVISDLSGSKEGPDITLSFSLPSKNKYTFTFEQEKLTSMEVIDQNDQFSFYICQLPDKELLLSYLMNKSNQRLLFVC